MNWLSKTICKLTGIERDVKNEYGRSIQQLLDELIALKKKHKELENIYVQEHNDKKRILNDFTRIESDNKIKENQISQQTSQIEQLNNNLLDRNNQIAHFKGLIMSKGKSINTLTTENNTLREQLDDLNIQKGKLLLEYNEQYKQIKELSKLTDRIAEKESIISDLVTEQQLHKNTIKMLEQQVKDTKLANDELNINNNNLKSIKDSLTEELQEKEYQITQYKNESSNYSTRINELTNENKELEQKIQLKAKDLLSKSADVENLIHDIESLKAEIENKDRAFSDLKQQYELIKETNKNIESKLKESTKVIEARNAEISAFKEKENENSMESSINNIEEMRALENQNQLLEEEIADQRREITGLNITIEQYKQQISERNEEFLKLRAEKRRTEETTNKLQSQIQSLKNENSAIEKEKSEANNIIDTLRSNLASLEQKNSAKTSSTISNKNNTNLAVTPFKELDNKESNNKKGDEEVTNSPTDIIPNSSDTDKRKVEEERDFHYPLEELSTKQNEDDKPHNNHNNLTPSKNRELEIIERSNGSIKDFPIITNDANRVTIRSIKYVYDEVNKRTIDANEFFKRSIEEIAKESRRLAEAAISGEIYWTCGCCRKRVKIGHRSYRGNESLFFVHGDRNINCPWSPWSSDSTIKKRDELGLIDDDRLGLSDNLTEEELQNAINYKEMLHGLLSSTNSVNMGINHVQINPVIISDIPYLRWKRPDLSFEYKNKRIVLMIQKTSHNISEIVDRDIFFRLNNIHIIWIFTSSNNSSYDYMRKLNYKDTMFDNHRNVFVFDEEARESSINSDQLLLKCNWLDDNDNWAIKISNSGSNGQLISLDKMIFDDEYCKPFYFDANKIYFEKHTDAKALYLENLKTREELLELIEENWTRDPNYLEANTIMRQTNRKAVPFEYSGLWGFKFNTTLLIAPIFDNEPKQIDDNYWLVEKDNNLGIVNRFGQKVVNWNGIIKCDDMRYDELNKRILFSRDDRWGVSDNQGNELISPQYLKITNWNTDIYLVDLGEALQLINIKNNPINPYQFEYVNQLIDNKAEASIYDVEDGTFSIRKGYLNEKGQIIHTESKKLANGTILFEEFENWGVLDSSGKVLIPCKFTEICYLGDELYKVQQEGKWGVYDISNSTYCIPIQYDSIGDFINGSALTCLNGVKKYVDKNNNVINEDTVDLQEGFKKTKIAGKWGIMDADNNEIIPHKYDEIGSFRSRLIGIINGRMIKLNASYQYPIHITGTYIGNDEKKVYMDVSGVKCHISKGSLRQEGYRVEDFYKENQEFSNLCFTNLIFLHQRFSLRVITDKALTKTISHGDFDTDFKLNEIVEGTITNMKKRNKVIRNVKVTLDDGRETIVTAKLFKSSHVNITNFKRGDNIKLRKTGYDAEYDRTIWEII